MKAHIVKFKKEIKEYQISQKKVIQKLEQEANIMKKVITQDLSVAAECGLSKNNNCEQNADIISKLTPYFQNFFQIYVNSLEEQAENKREFWEKMDEKENIVEEVLELFNTTIKVFKKQYSIVQNIINAFENDKIKAPIEDIELFIVMFSFTTLTVEEINNMLGMTFVFNSKYAKKNPNHNLKDIEIINKLAKYYNSDGSFNENEDVLTYDILINELWENIENSINPNMKDSLEKINSISADDLVKLLIEHIKYLKENPITKEITTDETKANKIVISKEEKESLKELRKYYRNSTIIKVPENLDEFYKLLIKCGLDNIEIQYIKELINKENNKKNSTLYFLSDDEKTIYEQSIYLLSILDYSDSDIYELKELINELKTIIDLLKQTQDEEDKEFLLKDIPNIINKLSIICKKHENLFNQNKHKQTKKLSKKKITKKA